ncbi:MAG: class I SAM-dependent methyltransferase [Chloroflexi bacterium]|nr:class I SAM-dependent methyltransferase [Chloroflexota bacterium]
MDKNNHSASHYIFEHSAQEAEQLQQQAHLLFPATRQVLQKAGITTGMSVLDVGTGAGDVALLAADLVGPTGMVVGVDSSPRILETARTRRQAAGIAHLSFLEEDLSNLKMEKAFDALIGRYILQHMSEPDFVLRQLVHNVRPGGIVAFLEADLTCLGTSVPRVPLFEQVGDWVKEAFHQSRIDFQMGLRLYHVFLEAGLPEPQIACESFLGGGPDWPWYDVMAGRVRSLLPVLLQHGIATAEEVDINTLAQRLRDTMVNQRSVGKAPDLVAAWTHI